MIYGAKGGRVDLDQTQMEYVKFGKGQEKLVIVPGLSDGLKTVKGTAVSMAWMFRAFAKSYTVYIFSRKNTMPEGYTTRDMAHDLKAAMGLLGIEKAHMMGMSQGGMIAQFFAIDSPEMLDKLVISVSVSKQNETIQHAIGNWVKLAEKQDYKTLFIDSLEKTYTENKLKSYRPLYPLLSKLGKPKSWERFIIQAKACLSHHAYDELDKIKAKTLVIGGDQDWVVGMNTSEEMAKKIAQSKLVVYKGLGHGAFDEAKDYNDQVIEFLKSH